MQALDGLGTLNHAVELSVGPRGGVPLAKPRRAGIPASAGANFMSWELADSMRFFKPYSAFLQRFSFSGARRSRHFSPGMQGLVGDGGR